MFTNETLVGDDGYLNGIYILPNHNYGGSACDNRVEITTFTSTAVRQYIDSINEILNGKDVYLVEDNAEKLVDSLEAEHKKLTDIVNDKIQKLRDSRSNRISVENKKIKAIQSLITDIYAANANASYNNANVQKMKD